ncbi:MAG: YhbY family RNA-binding protein [Rhodocyclaceae bacterium]|nr:YhbY family RNA-binding protein [Rhodocyclaceae bacterium]MBZ0131426.1 YhbY family RNA-binding protein [Rhodocyclaceae bacterium]MCO5096168.1 YhbY family RNA-binding protein [Rhodocyclaceae bacterium]
MLELNSSLRRALRARAHNLHPVVSISQKGLSETVLAEIDRCLKAHELIKVRVYDVEHKGRDALLTEICTRLDAAPVQHIGNVLVVFREHPEALKAVPRPAKKPNSGARKEPPAKPATLRRRTGR